MIVETNGSDLQRLSFYLLVASLATLISGVLARPLTRGLIWLIESMLGKGFLPTRLRGTGVLSQNLRNSSKHSSEWLSTWRNKWHGWSVPPAILYVFFVALAI